MMNSNVVSVRFVLVMLLTWWNIESAAQIAAPRIFASTPTAKEPTVDSTNVSPQLRFERLLNARGENYEEQRVALFADKPGLLYLQQRFGDADVVKAFVARHLFLWGTAPPREIVELEAYLRQGIVANRPQQGRSAGGWWPGRELAAYLGEKGDPPLAYDHLLLRMLMQPGTSQAEDYASSTFFADHPVPEPEVWIRIAMERGDETSINRIVSFSLPRVDRRRLLRALNHEHQHASQQKQQVPTALDTLRKQISAGSVIN
jgi:hypothetical protein